MQTQTQAGRRPQDSEHTAPTSTLPAAAVLSFLEDTRGTPSWSRTDLAKSLRISAAEARKALAFLEAQGYVERTSDEWLTTNAGTAVPGSKPPRFTQATITSALSELAERIKAVNHDPKAPFHVRNAVAFGDFLSGRARVQAPDVGIQLRAART